MCYGCLVWGSSQSLVVPTPPALITSQCLAAWCLVPGAWCLAAIRRHIWALKCGEEEIITFELPPFYL